MRSPVRAPKPDPTVVAAAQPHVRPAEPRSYPSFPLPRRPLAQAVEEMLGNVVPLAKSSVGGRCRLFSSATQTSSFLEPASFVRLGIADDATESWKTWERGVPELVFEILGDGELSLPVDERGTGGGAPLPSSRRREMNDVVAAYDALGVRELVVLDLGAPEGHRLRVWDRLDGDFVERIVIDERTLCCTLECDLSLTSVVVGANETHPVSIRLVRQGVLVATKAEADAFAAEAERVADEAFRVEEAARQADAAASQSAARSQRAEALARGETRAAEIEAAAARVRAGR